MPKQVFQTRLERQGGTGSWTYITLPFDVAAVFGSKAQVKVRGTVNGVPYRSSVMPFGDGTHYMVVNRAIREAAGAKAGDTVTVELDIDREPRTVELPAELVEALGASPEAKAFFDKIPYSHKKEYVDFITEAKKPETRRKRVAKSIEMLLQKTTAK
ncbi:MAG: DUF1905 domain-containing protein [Chloroflexi bacterium]|nr:DUF1905 domain-containing protein [Chloroflexota bacterium]